MAGGKSQAEATTRIFDCKEADTLSLRSFMVMFVVYDEYNKSSKEEDTPTHQVWNGTDGDGREHDLAP